MYNTPNLRNMAPWLTKRLRENEIGKGYLLNTGKLNAWDLPEFEVARNDMATERDLGLSDLSRRLSGAGVQGPAAGLLMEKAGNKYSEGLLNLANKLRGSFLDRSLNIGTDALNQDMKEKQYLLAARAAHEARSQQPNDWEKWNKGIQQGVGTVSSLANLGFGAGAMMGAMPPGLQGTSPASLLGATGMSSGLDGQNFMQLLQQIIAMMNGPKPSGSTWG